MSALPIILCGQRSQIAQGVRKGLEPEYDVIHVILSVAQGVLDIPALLAGEIPPPAVGGEQVGSGNYSKLPVAVVTGGSYDDEKFKQLYEASTLKGKSVVWLRPDLSVETPPLGPKYGEHMVERTKACLKQLKTEGKLEAEGGGDEVVFF